MKSILKKFLLILILGMLFPFFLSAKDAEKEVLRYVSVDSVDLKEKASVRSHGFYELLYADVVVLENEKENWCYVSVKENPNIKGWVNSSALTKRKIVANGRSRFVEADEIALAGKGLDQSLSDIQMTNTSEKPEFVTFLKNVLGYQKEEQNYYDFIDEVDSTKIDEEELFEFIEDGNLKLKD